MTYYILFKIILQIFFKFLNFPARYSNKMYSYNRGGGVTLLFST